MHAFCLVSVKTALAVLSTETMALGGRGCFTTGKTVGSQITYVRVGLAIVPMCHDTKAPGSFQKGPLTLDLAMYGVT